MRVLRAFLGFESRGVSESMFGDLETPNLLGFFRGLRFGVWGFEALGDACKAAVLVQIGLQPQGVTFSK